MGKRYFCDYCNRSFQDNLHNRKKHLNGVQHLRAKKVWYDLFRDAAAILQEEQTKKPCRKFLQTGQCDFGSNCRFSHMTEEDLEKLGAQGTATRRCRVGAMEQGGLRTHTCALAVFPTTEERWAKEQQPGAMVLPLGTVEDWLEKRSKRLGAALTNRTGNGHRTEIDCPPHFLFPCPSEIVSRIPSLRKSQFSNIHLAGLPFRSSRLPSKLHLLADGGSHPISSGDEAESSVKSEAGFEARWLP
ncbi:hypothetical protein lerEdw1_019445 [Lerista edwardsae]|nr:hypothetical protein lerEdw1_019445 [Lerista edwardsae]